MSKRNSISSFLRKKPKKEEKSISNISESFDNQYTLFNQYLQCISSVPFPSIDINLPLYISLSFTKMMISKHNASGGKRVSSNLEQLMNRNSVVEDFVLLREESWENLQNMRILHVPSLDLEFGTEYNKLNLDSAKDSKRRSKRKMVKDSVKGIKRELSLIAKKEIIGRLRDNSISSQQDLNSDVSKFNLQSNSDSIFDGSSDFDYEGSTSGSVGTESLLQNNLLEDVNVSSYQEESSSFFDSRTKLNRTSSESILLKSRKLHGYSPQFISSSFQSSTLNDKNNQSSFKSISSSSSSNETISEVYDRASSTSYTDYPPIEGELSSSIQSSSYNGNDNTIFQSFGASFSENETYNCSFGNNFLDDSPPIKAKGHFDNSFRSSTSTSTNSTNISRREIILKRLSSLETELKVSFSSEDIQKKWKRFIKPNDYVLAIEFSQNDPSKKQNNNSRIYLLKTNDCRLFIETTVLISILWKAAALSQEVDGNTLIMRDILGHIISEERIMKRKLKNFQISPKNSNTSEQQTVKMIEQAMLRPNQANTQSALLYLHTSIISIMRRREEIKDYKQYIEIELTKRMKQIEQESTQWMRDSEDSYVYSFLELTLIYCSKLLEQNDNTLQHLIEITSRCLHSPHEIPNLNQFRHKISDSLTNSKFYKETQKDINDIATSLRECAIKLTLNVKLYSKKAKNKIEEQKKIYSEELKVLESSLYKVIEEETNWLKTDVNVLNGSLDISSGEDILTKDPTPTHLKVHKQRLLNRITRIDNQSANLNLKKDILENDFDTFDFEKLKTAQYIEPQYHIFCLDNDQLDKFLEKKLVKNNYYIHSQIFLQQAYLQRIFLLNDNIKHLIIRLKKLLSEYNKEIDSRKKDQTLLEKEFQICLDELEKDDISQERRTLHGRYIDLCRVRLDIVKLRIQISEKYRNYLNEELLLVQDRLSEQHLSILLEIQKSLIIQIHEASSLTIVDSCTIYETNTFQEIVNMIFQRYEVDNQIVNWKEELSKLKILLTQLRTRNINSVDPDITESLNSKSFSQEYIHSEKESMMQDIVLQKVSSQWYNEKSPASECLEIFFNNIQNHTVDDSQIYTIENFQFVIQHIADLLCTQYPELQEHVEYTRIVSMIEDYVFEKKSIYEETMKYACTIEEDNQFLIRCEIYRNFVLNNVMGDELQHKIILNNSLNSSESIVNYIKSTFKYPIDLLIKLGDYHSPSEKLKQITNAAKSVITSLGNMKEKKGDGIGADDFLPIFIVIVLISKIPNLGSEINFIEKFGNEDILINEYGYFFTSLQSAKHYISQSISQAELE